MGIVNLDCPSDRPATVPSSLPLMGIVNSGCGVRLHDNRSRLITPHGDCKREGVHRVGQLAAGLITPHGDCKPPDTVEVKVAVPRSLPLMGIVN